MVLKWMLNPWAKRSSEVGRGLIGDEDHDDVGPLDDVGNRVNLEAGLLRLGDGF